MELPSSYSSSSTDTSSIRRSVDESLAKMDILIESLKLEREKVRSTFEKNRRACSNKTQPCRAPAERGTRQVSPRAVRDNFQERKCFQTKSAFACTGLHSDPFSGRACMWLRIHSVSSRVFLGVNLKRREIQVVRILKPRFTGKQW